MKRWSLNAWNDWVGLRAYEHGGIMLLRLHVGWERGACVSVNADLLGFGCSLSFYPHGKYAAESSWSGFAGAAVSGYVEPIREGQAFQFYPDNWPEGVPVESLGREHAE